jgi:hypothetical protein
MQQSSRNNCIVIDQIVRLFISFYFAALWTFCGTGVRSWERAMIPPNSSRSWRST